MPHGGLLREGVVEVGENQPAAAGQEPEKQIAQDGGQQTEDGFRRVGGEPAKGFEQK
jgi:hypothetical protein